jgi:hypothetical protein
VPDKAASRFPYNRHASNRFSFYTPNLIEKKDGAGLRQMAIFSTSSSEISSLRKVRAPIFVVMPEAAARWIIR